MKFKSRHKQRGYFAPAVWTAIAAVGSTAANVYTATKGAPKIPQAPQPPTQDTAANASNQQADLDRRRRGVLANIMGGQNATAPTVSNKTQLGS